MSQSLSLLERVSETKESNLAELWGDLPGKAISLLGYDFLQKHRDHMTLHNALNEADARPFTVESVEKYKKEVVKNANRFLFAHRHAEKVLFIAGLSMLLSFGPAFLGWFVSWKVGLIFATSLVGSLSACAFLTNFTQKSEGKWQITPLKGYAQPVPEFVIIQAVALKEKLPGAEFFVHEFVQDKKVLDPFLAIQCAGEEHLIAVWNEPKFEAKQEV
jgi:hypothetical protein